MVHSCLISVETPRVWFQSRCRSHSTFHNTLRSVSSSIVWKGDRCRDPCSDPHRALHSSACPTWGHTRTRLRRPSVCTSSARGADSTNQGADMPEAPQAASQGLMALLARASTLLPYAVLGSALLSLCVFTSIPRLARCIMCCTFHKACPTECRVKYSGISWGLTDGC